MGSFSILKGVFSIFVVFNLPRPMSCRRTAVTSRKDFAQFDHNIAVKCHRKCLLLRLQHKYTVAAGSDSFILSQEGLRSVTGRGRRTMHPYQKDCFNFCVNREIEKETHLGSVPKKTYVVIDSNEKSHKNLVLQSRMPHLPKKLYGKVNPRLWPAGDCDAFNSFANIDMTMKHAVLPKHVTVTCVNKNRLLVTWEQPKELRNCSGYQVNYRLGQNFGSGRLHCYEVAENKRAMLIDQSKGFQGQQEIFLAVTALPLPLKCDIKLQKFELCKGKDVLRAPIRKRRNINTTSHCLPTPPTTSSTMYAGKANITNVLCMEAGNFSKKSFIVQWTPPKDYKTVPFTHFHVYYTIIVKDVITDPFDINCRQVSKNTFSYKIENLDRSDTIEVLVVPYPTHNQLMEPMKLFTPCLKTDPPTTRPTASPSPKPRIRVEVIIGVVLAIVFALAISASLFIYRKRLTTRYNPKPVKQEKIYVSYYPDSNPYHSSLLNLVAKLRRVYSVNLIMDSYCQTEVSELGLARWCQKQMSGSTRILMVISEEYLKICNEWKNGSTDMLESNDVDVSRVCSELQYVVDQIFERRKNSLLTIVLADVNQSDLPDFLRGMKTFSWPKGSDDENAVVCNICAEEATVTV